MKAISLLLAAAGGAGVLYHNQLQTWITSPRQGTQDVSHHQAPEGVYYLRTAYMVPTGDGAVRWSAGQELRLASDTLATQGAIAVTDGTNTADIPQTALTRDMDEASALRQVDASSQSAARLSAQQEAARQMEASRQANSSHLVSGQFHPTTLDASAVRTNRLDNIVSTAGAPVMYSTSQTVIIDRRSQINRTVISGPAPPQRQTRTVNPPTPVISRY